MISYATLEPLLVGLIVAASGAFALRRFAPRSLARLARLLNHTGLPTWGIDLLCGKPSAQSACGTACGGCANSCTTKPIQNKPLVRTQPGEIAQKN